VEQPLPAGLADDPALLVRVRARVRVGRARVRISVRVRVRVRASEMIPRSCSSSSRGGS
jgi:hypothetical protein